MSNIEVIGLGALNLDRVYLVERILSDGEALATQVTLAPGGSAANTIYGLARLEVSTGFVGAIGDDREGGTLLCDLSRVRVDTRQIKVKKRTETGSTLCITDREGKRAIYVHPGANSLLTCEDIDLAYISQAHILHLSSFVDEQQLTLQKELVARIPPPVKVSFAPGSLYAVKGIAALEPIISRSYIIFLNSDEVKLLTGKDFRQGARELHAYGCHIVVVTLGAGIMVSQKMATAFVAAEQGEYLIEARGRRSGIKGDTVGAGDAFAAGFLYGLIQGKPPKECGYLGAIVGRFCTTKIGARAGLPTLSKLIRRYREERGLTL